MQSTRFIPVEIMEKDSSNEGEEQAIEFAEACNCLADIVSIVSALAFITLPKQVVT